MQYILTEEEYQKLVGDVKQAKQDCKETIEALCIRVANSEPVKLTRSERQYMNKSWADSLEGKPWGCYITREEEHPGLEWYCDHCPVKKICPLPHHSSK